MIKLEGGTGSECYLRNASFGDSWEIDTNIVLAQTMTGVSKSYKGNRPSFQYSRITSEVNKKDDIEDLIAFLTVNAGLEITITTYYDEVAMASTLGFVINPISEIITRKSPCDYSVTLEFLHSNSIPAPGITPNYLYPTDCPT